MADNKNPSTLTNHDDETATFSFHRHCMCLHKTSGSMIKCGEGSTQSYVCSVCGGHQRYRRWHTVVPQNGKVFKFLRLEEFAINSTPSPRENPPENQEILEEKSTPSPQKDDVQKAKKRKFFTYDMNASCAGSSNNFSKSFNRRGDDSDDDDSDSGAAAGCGILGSG